MFILNFDPQSASTAWTEDISLVAADDGTPIVSVDGMFLTLQVRAKTPRGFGDQTQNIYAWPNSPLGFNFADPEINVSTNDGTGQLTLVSGVLSIRIPATIMNQLRPGYHEVGLIMKNADTSEQIASGVLPLLNGGVWS